MVWLTQKLLAELFQVGVKTIYSEGELMPPSSGDDDIIAKVKRISDQKIFEIGLSWLECNETTAARSTMHVLMTAVGSRTCTRTSSS